LIAGRVVDDAGAAVSGAAVIVYGTDAAGLYNPRNSPTREPRLQATVQTDAEGRFQVLTVMPGAYPDSDDPAHIHLDIKAAGFGVHYSAIWFKGDPRINDVTTARAKDWERRHPNDVTKVEKVVKDERGMKIVQHVITISKKNQ
jgi:protocatechuate 3,4-dioxygenase beta subunit